MRWPVDAFRVGLKLLLVWLGRHVLPASWAHAAINKLGLRHA